MSRLPQVTAREIVAFLKAQCFAEDRKRGSHLTLVNKSTGRTVTVPVHPGDMGRGLALRILSDAGFSVDDFLRMR